MEAAKISNEEKPARKSKAEKTARKKSKHGARAYELPNPLVYRLSDPGYTIYHRAALGGLAATIGAWQDTDNEHDPPQGITSKLTRDTLELSWSEDLLAVDVVRRILEASFKLTSDKLIDLPGHCISEDKLGLRLAVHNGLMGTFLQHTQARSVEKNPLMLKVGNVDDEASDLFSYKAVHSYSHQSSKSTGLLDGKLSFGKVGSVVLAKIPQSVIPGVTSGKVALQIVPKDALLLMFLMVGCSVFMLRPRTYKEKAQSCLIVPDVFDLLAFARALRNIAAAGQTFRRFSNSYLGRVVGGAEEAALRFLIDLQAGDVTLEGGVSGCLVVAMGKVSWDKNQINRSVIARVRTRYAEMDVFRAADEYLGKSKAIKTDKGESYVIPETHIPELVAANLAAERHWCAQFRELIEKKKDFENMSYHTYGGLKKMREAIRDETDQTLIRAFQEAWRLKRGALRARELREGLKDYRLIEVEREKMRNAILRTKTANTLAGWLMQFCGDATREYQSAALARDLKGLREFIFNPRNFERFQNLCLFALVSYSRDETPKQQTVTTGGEG
ncbi:MAG TPA: type I-MYXAN CRISPR-associated Cas8a1/Cmx1 [Pyrinomonadaceae bacterium]|jgi:CRISPR-associated protein Cas8a1/Csx13|nr:type I-MYXAN CRISPR-associated Cas8a1/Cmx1 [Pyrinomonadaceae bacterium]